MSKGSKRRPGKPGAYETGWELIFGPRLRRACTKRVSETCCGHSNCENPPAEEHTCPYQEDINNDHTFTCTCCADCQHECAMDI